MKNNNAATGGSTASRRPKIISLAVSHDVIERAFRKHAAHCAGVVALKNFAKRHGLPWRSIVVDEIEITLVDTEQRTKLMWHSPRKLAFFIKAFDEGKVIDDDGVIHTADDLTFTLKLADAQVKPIAARKPRTPRTKSSSTKPRVKRSSIPPSYHRNGGIRGADRIAEQMLVA
jgi:hypothetical protein